MILRSSRNKICSLKIFRQATGSKCHKKLNWKMKILPRLLPLIFQAAAFDYSLTGAGNIVLADEATSITDIVTIFTDESVLVTVDGIEWNATGSVEGSDNLLRFETLVDGETQASGSISLEDVSRELPTSIDAGAIKVDKGGRYTIEVILSVDSSEESTSESYEAYAAGVAIIPLIMVLVFAITTQMVECSLFLGVFIGACIVAGNINDGFKATLDNYILGALANVDHGYVYLFTFFLSGLVAILEKSGGMFGFTKDISKYATSPRTGQLACFAIGCLVFFDDYANSLLAGKTMRPLLDSLFVSREKLAFIVDATAAPVASISPISSWVGFEIGLIQEQIDRIIEIEGTEDIGIKTSGFAVFLQSIKYRYYPIFMLILMVVLIFAQRDAGSMLIAERKSEVYQRTDGGDGAAFKPAHEAGSEGPNEPKKGTPLRSWNMLVPIVLLIFLIFYLLVKTGEIEGDSQTVMDKVENSDSYSALLWGTMAASMLTIIFYHLQIVREGEMIIPNASALADLFWKKKDKDEDAHLRAHFLLGMGESVESFLYGMGHIFPALIVLTLAWASGAIMVAVGADRLFSRWIVGGINPEALPTLSFLISLFMALATGTSWGTMTILFPLILVPTYEASNGDEIIFYAVVAGILSGSVAGDHMSPISDTTVLSSLACECGLLEHVFTQVPYVIVTVIISTLFGTIPIGYGAWPNIVGILLGVLLLVAFVYIVCVPVISPAGRFDIFTEMYLRVWDSADLIQLKVDTAKAYNGEHPTDGDVEVSDQAGANPKHEEADKVMENSEECDEECDEDEETSGKEIAV